MAKKLIGTDANQVPINGFLGDLAYQNADNLKRINVNSGTLFVDSENNRVGVGTSSPNSILHIDYTENDADSVINTSQALFVQNGGNGPASIKLNASVSNKHQIVYGGGVGSEFNLVDRLSSGSNRFSVSSNGDISFYEDTGTTPKFFWDASAERLGIGTSSPDTSLSIDNRSASNNEHQVLANFQGQTSTSNGFSRYIIVNDHSRFGAIYNADSGSEWGSLVNGRDSVTISTGDIDAQQNRLIIRDNGETRFRTNNSEAARIDSSGNVGIGTSSPEATLHVVDEVKIGRKKYINFDGENTTSGESNFIKIGPFYPFESNSFILTLQYRVGSSNTANHVSFGARFYSASERIYNAYIRAFTIENGDNITFSVTETDPRSLNVLVEIATNAATDVFGFLETFSDENPSIVSVTSGPST